MTIIVSGSVRKKWSKNHSAQPAMVRRTALRRVSPGAHPLGISVVLLLILIPGPDVMAETTDVIQADSVLIQLIDQVEVPSRAAGVLSASHVVEGQVVEKGKLLAQIDDAEARLIGQRAKIELRIARENATDDVAVRSAGKAGAFARSEHERLKRAASELAGSVLKSELEEAALRCEQARLDLERAQRDLHLTTLTTELKENELLMSTHNFQLCKVEAPLGGVVVEVLRRPGEWVQAGDRVVRIVRMDRLRAADRLENSRRRRPVVRRAQVHAEVERVGPRVRPAPQGREGGPADAPERRVGVRQ